MSIVILDYGVGNIQSITNALNYVGIKNSVIDQPCAISNSAKLILPGVGAFGYALDQVNSVGLGNFIKFAVK